MTPFHFFTPNQTVAGWVVVDRQGLFDSVGAGDVSVPDGWNLGFGLTTKTLRKPIKNRSGVKLDVVLPCIKRGVTANVWSTNTPAP